MSEILIKGLEMPKGNDVLIVDSAGTITKLNTWTGKREATDPLSVKAIELPPHDDLISRSDAIDTVYGYHFNNHPMKELEELPSIIPASEGMENKRYYSDPSCKNNMWDGEKETD